jgi:hypothetical protein
MATRINGNEIVRTVHPTDHSKINGYLMEAPNLIKEKAFHRDALGPLDRYLATRPGSGAAADAIRCLQESPSIFKGEQ